MWKAISALAIAVLAAGAITVLPGLSPDVEASTSPQADKGDRIDVSACSLRGWPYYEPQCLKDYSRNAGRAASVRLITTDRLMGPAIATLPEWAAYLPALNPAPIQLSRLH